VIHPREKRFTTENTESTEKTGREVNKEERERSPRGFCSLSSFYSAL
jgi:hypothetical protein